MSRHSCCRDISTEFDKQLAFESLLRFKQKNRGFIKHKKAAATFILLITCGKAL